MKKATKGALAAAAAGSLLVGGAGSLAFWTSTGTVSGTDITSGHLTLTPGSGAACDTFWKLNGTQLTSQVLKPGDTLTRHCKYAVSMDGTSLLASLSVSTPDFTAAGDSALKNDMTITGDFKYDADGAGTTSSPVDITTGTGLNTGISSIANNATVDATITVTYKTPTVENNASNLTGQNLTAALGNVTIVAEQAH